MMEIVFERVEKNCGKRRKCWLPEFYTFSTRLKKGLLLMVVKTLEIFYKGLTLSQTSPGFCMSAVQVFNKSLLERRNCLLQAISPFLTVFSTCLEIILPFSSNLKLSSANSFNLEESKICRLGKG